MNRQLMTCVFFAALIVATPAWAATIHVPADQPTIQAGIDAASAGDTVLVACGTYYEHDIVVKSGIALLSETGAPGCAIIDAQQLGRVLYCVNMDLGTRIEGFTLQRGRVEYADGGGMYCAGSFLVLRQIVFFGSMAWGDGGGLYCRDSSPNLTDVAFSSNTADYGGGLYCEDSSPVLTNVTFSDNVGTFWSGGMASEDSHPVLAHVSFRDNWSSAGPGGMGTYRGFPTLEDVVFSGNFGGDLGGGMSLMGPADLVDVTFVGNRTWPGGRGGGIFCHESPDGPPTLTNVTFFGNEATQGGAVYCSGNASLNIERSIIAFGADGEAIYCDPTSVPTITHSCVYGNAGGDSLCGDHHDNIFEDPLFCDAPAGDLSLHTDSPCLPENNPWGVLIGAHGEGCGAAVTSTVDFDPNTLNCRSQGQIVTCWIELPAGHDPADVDVATVVLNDSLPALAWPTEVGDYDVDGIPDRMVKFDRSDVIGLLPVGEEVEVTVSGELVDGTAFAGVDSIRVLCKQTPAERLPPPHSPSLRVGPGEVASSATISYGLEVAGPVRLRVYDVSGRLVRTLVDGHQAKGEHHVTWDQKSDGGRDVSAGVYFLRLECSDGARAAKALVLK